MAFNLVTNALESDLLEEITIASLTVTKGDLLYLTVGNPNVWALATAGGIEHWHQKAVAAESATTAATTLKVVPVLPGMRWIADCTNTSVAADIYDRNILTDQATVNNTSTDSGDSSAIFTQIAVVGALSDKKLLGKIAYGNGVDSDAS